VHVGPALFARQRRLVAAIQAGCDEGWALEAILALAGDCLRTGDAPAPAPRTARRDRELVEGVRHAISTDPSSRAPLVELARAFGVGPVTLCTTFRRVTGRSIHAYRLDLRLELALEQLERAGDLTRIALDLGFDSHSHFSRHFRARFGASPSRLREDLMGLGKLRSKERDSAPPPGP
jgi:AraC-like DNA-binding protein